MASPFLYNSPQAQHLILYAFGSNGSAQLGLGHQEDVSTPQPVLGRPASWSAQVSDLRCGGNHSVILYDDGAVAVAGDNADGRCLSLEAQQKAGFTLLADLFDEHGQVLSRIQHITATWSATAAVTKDGAVLTCGTGNSGELGCGPNVIVKQVLAAIDDFPPSDTTIVKLSSCMGHVVAVLSNGEAWGWGRGRQGQLGEPAEHRWKPTKIGGIAFFAVDAICGKDFTCVFGNPSTGKLMMLGLKSKDRFGVRINTPGSLPRWKQVAASWGSVFVLLESGRLLGWGRDDHGQLPPQNLPPLERISAGSEHCLGLTEAGAVLAWGWGEHGNCGPDTNSTGDVKGRWNEIETHHSASAIFAGCATSFVTVNPPRE